MKIFENFWDTEKQYLGEQERFIIASAYVIK